MYIFRRFLVLAALLFWQGGFVFFSSVVVPIGRQELGPRSKATVITTRVSKYINLAGAAAMLPLLWDAAVFDPCARRRRLRYGLWVVLLLTLVAQVYLYGLMSEEVNDILSGNDPPYFRLQHSVYLSVSTAQLAAAVAYLVFALMAWRAQDRTAAKASTLP